MAFSQILSVANRTNVTLATPAVAVSAGLTEWTVRVDLGTPQNFSNPATQHLTIAGEYSFDGGTTWQPAAGGTVDGSATSTWGKGSPNPLVGGAVPINPSYPTHVRGRVTQVGTFRFGLSIEVV